MDSTSKKVLLIGWDAADWNFITPLLDAGRMPYLARLIERGVMGNLASMLPMLSPILWTTIATGKRGDEHGICSFLEPAEDGIQLRTVSSSSRTTKALWNIATQSGLHSNVVAWYATHPAEPISGVAVSDRFLHVDELKLPDWPLPDGAVHPKELADAIASLRVRPTELKAADLLPFIPTLHQIDLHADDRPRKFGRMLAHTASVHAVTTALLESEPWNLVAVFYDGLDVAGHTFMPMHPPAMSHVSADDAMHYGAVMTRLYEFHDAMLGRLIQLAGEEATIVLVSDHGFHHADKRPIDSGESEEEQAALWHRPLGIIAMCGPKVRADERIYGASLLDIAPTVLAALGLQAGRDMPGRVLIDAFIEKPDLNRIHSWDAIPADNGLHPPELRVDPIAAAESIRQLADLGYLPSTAVEESEGGSLMQRVLDERAFNLSVIYSSSGRAEQSVAVLAPLVARSPKNQRYTIALAQSLSASERPQDALKLLQSFSDRAEQDPHLALQIAEARLAAGQPDEARQLTIAMIDLDPPMHQTNWGFLCRQLGLLPEARRCLRRAVDAEPQRAEALYGLAAVELDLKDYDAALEYGRRAVGVLHGFPAAHHLIAVAYTHLGDLYAAMRSIRTTLTLDATFKPAHELGEQLSDRLGDVAAALRHRRALNGHPWQA